MSWFDDYGIDEEELEEEGTIYKGITAQRDAVIFLIDCSSPSMLDPMPGVEESALQLCLRCAKNVQQSKIISSDKDLSALVLFGTKLSSNDMKGVYVLQTLDQPDADRIKALEGLIAKDRDFDAEFGTGQDYSLADALWTCLDLFSKSSVSLGFKRILLFTNEDDPHATKPHLRRQAYMRMEDLRQNNVDLELIHLQPADGHSFSLEPFYKDLLVSADDELTALPDPAARFEELLARVKAKDHKKRALSRLPLELGPGLELNVGVYNLVRSCPAPSAVKLDKASNEELKRQSRVFLQSTAEMLLPQDLKKAIEFAGRRICFETDEVDEIRKLAPPGLKLLGFKPMSFLKTHFHVRAAQFLYPDESGIEGSTTAFSALLQRCLARRVMPLCRYVARSNAAPSHVVLVPQAEVKNESGVQMRPPGFHLVVLPYADDLRTLELPKLETAEPEQIDAAKELVKKLTVRFDPENFENPKLQNFYSYLEAVALDRDEPEGFDDHTEPDKELIEKRAGDLIEVFKKVIAWTDPKGAKRAGGGETAAAKKARLDSASAVDLGAEARSGRLAKLTVPVLKEAMRVAGIKSAGTKKADLLEAINTHFGVQ